MRMSERLREMLCVRYTSRQFCLHLKIEHFCLFEPTLNQRTAFIILCHNKYLAYLREFNVRPRKHENNHAEADSMTAVRFR